MSTRSLPDLLMRLGVDDSAVVSGFDGVAAQVDDAADDVERKWSDGLGGLKAVSLAAGAAAGAAIVAGALEGMERERVGDKTAAAFALDPAEQQAAGAIAGRLYADAYGESIGEVSDAVGMVQQQLTDGLSDTSAVEDLTAKALDFAAAFDQDVSGAIQNAENLMSSGLASSADEAFDQMVAGTQNASASVRDELGEAVNEYSQFFGQLGLDGAEAFGLLGEASNNFEVDKIGDSLKELTIRSTDMSKASVEAYEAAGLSAEDMSAKFLTGGDVARGALDDLVEGLLGIEDPTARANAAIGLFGTPLEDLGVAEIPTFLESLRTMGGGMEDVEGAAVAMGDTLNDNASTRVEGHRRAVEGWLAKVVEAPGALGAAAGGVAGFGAAMQPVAPMLTGVAVVFQQQFATMAAAAGRGIAASAGWAVSTAKSAAMGAAGMVKSAAIIVATYARLAVQSLIQAGRMAASWIIAMGPVAWVIAGVIALVALIIANWDTVVEWTRKAWTWVTDKIGDAWQWITGTTSAAVGAVVDWFVSLRDRAVAAVGSLRDRVVDFFVGIRDRLVEVTATIVDRVVDGFVELKDGAIKKATALVDWIGGLPGRIMDGLGNVGTMLLGAGRAILQGLWDGLRQRWDDVSSWVGGLGDRIRDLKGPIRVDRKLLVDEGGAIMEGLGKGLADGWVDNERMLAGMSSQIRDVFAVDVRVPGVSDFGDSSGGAALDGQDTTVQLVTPDGTVLMEWLMGGSLQQAARAGA